MSVARYDLDQLVLVRSDLGDGGWSIHVRRTDVDEAEDPVAAWPIVASGEASSDGDGGWDRPNHENWREARAAAAALID